MEDLLEANLSEALESHFASHCWQYYNGLILLRWLRHTFLNEAHFHHFYIWLSYFWCFQGTSPFELWKFEIIPRLYFKCNSVFHSMYVYSYWWIISHFFMFLMIHWHRIWPIRKFKFIIPCWSCIYFFCMTFLCIFMYSRC